MVIRRLHRWAWMWAVVLVAAWAAAGSVRAEQSYRIGVLAFRGADHAVRSWRPTALSLSAAIMGASFTVVPLPLAELRRSVAEKQVDFVFTNPGQYVELEAEFGISRIATVKTPFGSENRNVFGAVIFARKDNQGIKTLDDLRGKIFAAVKPGAFGGFQMAWRELKAAGIDPFTDFQRIDFLGLPQDQIVFAVRDRQVDAGTVRTDVLETMAIEDAIDINDFLVLYRKTVPGHDVLLSTRLYPEWPFASLPHTPTDLSEKVAITLLSLPAASPAVRATGYAGWTVPLDYKPVHDMFHDLQIGPYQPGEVGVMDIMRRHWEWVVFALIILALTAVHGVRTEYLVQRRTRQLSEANQDLEIEITERRRAEDRARRHEAELAHVSRVSVISEMTSGLAHELRQPLSAINNYAEGGIRRLQRRGGETPEDIREALENISEQATRAGKIISRVRGYLRKQSPKHDAVDVNHAIEEAATLIRQDAKAHKVRLSLNLGGGLPKVSGDIIEIEQLIINLAKNAIDCMSGPDWPDRDLEIATTAVNEGVRVEIRDTGPGLNAADQKDIWQPFFSSKPSGLGLGLAICRTIVDLHGGRIWAEDRDARGTVMIFELPALNGGGHAN